MLLVAFSGHGIEREGQPFLLPSDSQVNGDIRLLEETAINVTRLKDAIKETGVGQVIFILDSCRNDPVGRADTDNPLTLAYTRGFNFDVRNKEVTAFVTLYATSVGQRAYEFKEKRQGYFTWRLVEGLKGRAANAKGEVTLAGLVRYLQEEVPKQVRIELGKEQRPFADIGGYKAEDLVIAVTGQATSIPTNSLPAPFTDTADVAVWEAIKNSRNQQDFKDYIKEFPNGRYVRQAKRQLRILEGQVESQPNNSELTVLPLIVDDKSVKIIAATPSIMDKSHSAIFIGGQGWDGGSEVKVIVNDLDITAQIESQDSGGIALKGSVKELNLRSGRNEIAVIVNGIKSNTYVFTQVIK
jgi:uncharacterized caspase-like protein